MHDRILHSAFLETAPSGSPSPEAPWAWTGPAALRNETLLGVSNPTVREWIEKGVLEDFGGRPQRVGLESVLRAAPMVDELRELGRDRDLVGAVLNRLESEALKRDRRFKRSLGQTRRGERGDWPEDF